MDISKFLHTELCDYASYDNIRKISSVVDGLKNSSRKVIYTMLKKNINNEIKVDALANQTAGFTEYLHGATNLNGVIVNLAQDFVGSNNLPLLTSEGNFGTRLIKEASAPRYIFTQKQKYLEEIFRPEDEDVLVEQIFEGSKIEPRYYVPILPLLVINGSEGVSTGFAQKILPRRLGDVKEYIQNVLENKTPGELLPHYNGYTGNIEKVDENKWKIEGKFEREKYGRLKITEIPPNYDLKSYLSVLDKLEENKTIKSYNDYCDDDICFEVQFEMKKLQNMSDEQVKETLKLIKYETENFTCIDENNKIVTFNNIHELMDYYIKFRLQKYEERKQKQLEKLNEKLEYMISKYYFIQDVINGDIDIKAKKNEVVKDIQKNDKILTYQNSYDYLLRMQIFSLTKEKCDELSKQIKETRKEIKDLQSKTEKQLWKDDIKNISI